MIPHNKPTLGIEEQQAATRVLASGWLAQGAEVEAFENEVCAFLDLPSGHAVALSSGTAALFMALQVLNGGGKTVGFPAYACSALRNAVAMVGARELLLDVTEGTPNVDLAQAQRLAPDILIAPHMYGLPLDLSGTGDMPVIEDCAQAIGAAIGQTAAGLQGTVGIFSFYATKLMTSGGQGGMLVSRDRDLIAQARDYRNFDCRPDQRPRFNLQMTDLQAAIGRVQLTKLPGWLKRREHLFDIYRSAGLRLLDTVPNGAHAAPVQAVRYRAVVHGTEARQIIARLAKNDIRAIVPLEDWELLGPDCPHASRLTQTTVSLPLYPSLTDTQAKTIASLVRDIS